MSHRIGKIGSVSNPQWRTLAHGPDGRDVTQQDAGEFDELCLGDWFHLEKMAPREWWMQVGDARIGVSLRAGLPPIVTVERGEYGPQVGENYERQDKPTSGRRG